MLHAGGGVFCDRTRTDPYASLLGNPPATVQPTVNYGRVAHLGSSSNVFNPPGLITFSTSSSIPTTFNFNVGVQSKLQWTMLLDVSYVGSISNHQLQYMNINAVPFGADFLPQNQDPTLQATSPNALPRTHYCRNFSGNTAATEILTKACSQATQITIRFRFRVTADLLRASS